MRGFSQLGSSSRGALDASEFYVRKCFF